MSEHPPWFSRFLVVARRNMRDLHDYTERRASTPVRLAWNVLESAMFSASAANLADVVAAAVYDDMPYMFLGPQHVIETWTNCRRRNYGACADAAAAVAAGLVLMQPRRSVHLCYEDPPDAPAGYAHCRVVLDGSPVEPWPSVRLEASCSALVDLRPLLLPGAGA